MTIHDQARTKRVKVRCCDNFFFFRLPVNKQPLTKGRIDIQVQRTRSLFVDNDISVYAIYITTLFASEV